MEDRFVEYINRATDIIWKVNTHPGIDEKERSIIIDTFCDELISNICKSERLEDSELLFTVASIKYLDNYLSSQLNKEKISVSECERAIECCLRQKQNIAIYYEKKQKNPEIEIEDLDACIKLFGLKGKLISEDEKLDELVNDAQKELHVDTCDSALDLISEMEKDFSSFKVFGTLIPILKNINIGKIKEKVISLREKSERKSNIYKSIKDNDNCLDDLIVSHKSTPQQWCEIIGLCKRQTTAFSVCTENGWELPSVKYRRLQDLENQYNHYYAMNDLDAKLATEVNSLSTDYQYKEFFKHCKDQEQNIKKCNQSGWTVPALRISDPYLLSKRTEDGLKEQRSREDLFMKMIELDRIISKKLEELAQDENYNTLIDYCEKQIVNIEKCKEKGWPLQKLTNDPYCLADRLQKEKKKNAQIRTIKRGLSIFIVLVFILLMIWIIVSGSRKGKIPIPFDSSYSIGKTHQELFDELKESGFSNITLQQDFTGWGKSGLVNSVSINNSNKFNKGKYVKPDASIIISYNSDGRINISDLVDNYNEMMFGTLQDLLKASGFEKITLEKRDTFEKEKDQIVAELYIDGNLYSGQEYFLPTSTHITIVYYSLRIVTGSSRDSLIGMDCESVVGILEEKGYNSIQTIPVFSGWNKSMSVLEIYINGDSNFASDSSFYPDDRILIYYSSAGRENITNILKEWQSKTYLQIKNELITEGFTNVSLAKVETDSKDRNLKISSIAVNSTPFYSGECYVSKSVPIKIEYYELLIEIGKKASKFEGEQYSDVVEELKEMGFTNIHLKRANDIGWFPIFRPKEGSIKSFMINGTRDFKKTDSFSFDSEIEIIVHTRENSGCEDIIDVI